MILMIVRLHQSSNQNDENQKISRKFKSLIAVKNQLRHQIIVDQMED